MNLPSDMSEENLDWDDRSAVPFPAAKYVSPHEFVGKTSSLTKLLKSDKSEKEPKIPKLVIFRGVCTRHTNPSASKWDLMRLHRHNFRKQLPINRRIIKCG